MVCVNLLDEAQRKGIRVDLERLSQRLGVPVVGCAARGGRGLPQLKEAVAQAAAGRGGSVPQPVRYPQAVEAAVDRLAPLLRRQGRENPRWHALRLLEAGEQPATPQERALVEDAWKSHSPQWFADALSAAQAQAAEDLARQVVAGLGKGYSPRDRKLDRLFTGRWTAFPVMALLLLAILWLTMVGANAPSQLLSQGFSQLGEWLRRWLAPRAPVALRGAGGRRLHHPLLGGGGDAAAHGHLFPPVHPAGGFGLPAPHGLQLGQVLCQVRGLR